jgi:outer membrane lipoprotein SlyB
MIHSSANAAEGHRAAEGRKTLAGSTPMKPFKRCLILTMLILSACADKRPVLYPNAHLKQVGHATAQADIDACIQYAVDNDAAANKGEEIAKSTAGGAAVGGAVGAATGAVLGNLGRGAAAGAAGGAAGGATRGILKSGDPDPVFKNFVNRCLKEKGYEPIGWR